MNFFFGAILDNITCSLTIPKFTNKEKNIFKNNVRLYCAEISKNIWKIHLIETEENENFFLINKNLIDNKKIFFIAKSSEIENFKNLHFKKIFSINSLTDTHPAFRANLELELLNGGFSSYQSEYPSEMVSKKGSVLSSLNSLTNKNADKNFLIFRNIFEEPIETVFNIYFIDVEDKIILDKHKIITNQTNIIEINKALIKPNIFLFSDGYVGIPIFLSIMDGHLSLEHTHPPYHYIIGKNNFLKTSELKKNIYDQIIKKNITH